MTETDYRLPLDHPLWEKLYGPYGGKHVAAILGDLLANKITDTGQDFCFEMVPAFPHLFPLTYAAAPWMFEFATKIRPPYLFGMIKLATLVQLGTGPDRFNEATNSRQKTGKFLGLPTSLPELHQSCTPNSLRIDENDLAAILRIEAGFSDLIIKIREALTLELRGEDPKYSEVFLYASGLAAIAKDFDLSEDLGSFSSGSRGGTVVCNNCGAWHDYKLIEGRIHLTDGGYIDPLPPEMVYGAGKEILAEISENDIMSHLICALSNWKTCPSCGKSRARKKQIMEPNIRLIK